MNDTKNSHDESDSDKQRRFNLHYSGTFVERRHAEQETDSQDEETHQNEREVLPAELMIVLRELQRAYRWLSEVNHDRIVAWFTIGIFVATAIYAGVATAQWYAMRDANRINRDALTVSSRAWISPVSAGFQDIPKLGNALKFGVQYANPGHSPALDVRPTYKVRSAWSSSFDDNSIKASIEADDVCRGVLEAPGADVIYPEQPNGYRLDFTLKEPNFINDPDIFDGKKAFILEMCFAYKTVDSLHHTSFCYFYRSGTTLPNQWNVCNAGNHAD